MVFPNPTLQQVTGGDSFLMDLVTPTADAFDPKTLVLFNWWRTFLKVTTVADLVTVDGQEIHLSIWGIIPCDDFTSHHRWPCNCAPSLRAVHTWRRVLWSLLLWSQYTNDLILRESLSSEAVNFCPWLFWYCAADDRLYHKVENGWISHRRIPGRTCRLQFWLILPSTPEPLPDCTSPATTSQLRN
eukprot:6684918-Ditylum_brightwellii.AAC.1